MTRHRDVLRSLDETKILATFEHAVSWQHKVATFSHLFDTPAEDIDVIETDDGDTITACGAPVARLHYERV